MAMTFTYNDGGRKAAGYQGDTGVCVVRAVAIATEQPYQAVYDALTEIERSRPKSKHNKRGSTTVRNGVQTRSKAFKDYMAALGWRWTPTMHIGSGCTVHLADGELPMGRIIVLVSRHMVAVIDSVIYDTHDPQRNGGRCVYGYWRKA